MQRTLPSHKGAWRHRVATGIRVATLALCLLVTGSVQAERTGEYELKAALLRQLMNYVEWPAGSPANVCIVGVDPFGTVLDRAFADMRPQLRRLSANSDDLPTCGFVFVAGSEASVAAVLLSRLPTRGTLSVSDITDFTDAGGMVAMRMQENRVRFRIDVGHARRAGLRVNAKLLRLSDVIGNEPQVAP